MTFEEAIKESIRKYYDRDDTTELELDKLGERQYTRDYFDSFEEEILGKQEKPNGPKA